ncbi:Phosphatidate phosphatase lpin1 [Phytophthora boehmeriae]|uniref:Phosphatidate phosphatase lpin1 n=1 Tax=Phytophthora boehmeriae TaxID=109152 RepID=A0A8T1X5K6_9STRA|nr:Phosphatidate phosphatase lpin1 [Phytophthora boehmeriae]
MQTYREIHGDLLMQVSFIVPGGDDRWPRATWGYKLGYWASELRRNRDKLLPYQVEDLETLKFSWNAREARWNQYFSPAIQRYKEIHGNSHVPQSFVVPSNDANWPSELAGYRLGQKVNNLRCGDPLGTGESDEAEWQEVELIYKSWMLLETLHDIEDGIEDSDGINDEVN